MFTRNKSLSYLLRIPRIRDFLIFAMLYFFVFIFQSYYLAVPPGWIDPWINLGNGQAFPETAFPGYRYKESRLLSIIWLAFVLVFPDQIYYYVIIALITATGVIIFKITRGFKAGFLLSISTALLVTLNPRLWGDAAGGGDYYNTFGNFLIVLAVYRLVIPVFRTNSEGFYRRNFFLECGFWLAIITLEIPSGLIVSAMIFTFLTITYFRDPNLRYSKMQKSVLLLQLLGKIGIGFAMLLVFESLLLLLLRQNPIRLLAGPKFLFDSVFNSSTQANWWTQIPLNNLQSLPSLFLFFVVTSIYLLFTMLLVFGARKKSRESNYEINLVTTFTFFLCLLVIMQIAGKTVALTIPYFTTPILILLFALIPAIVPFRNSWLFAGLMSIFLFFSFENRFLLIHVGTLLVLIIGKALKRYDLINSWSLILLLIFSLVASGVSFNSFQSTGKLISEVCNTERLKFRSDLIRASHQLDNYGPRGTIMMGSDDFIFTQKAISDCDSFDNAPLSFYLISLSSLGYPSAANLGPLEFPVEPIGDKFYYESFTQITKRINPVTGCYINFVEQETKNRIVISKTNFNFEYLCVGEK